MDGFRRQIEKALVDLVTEDIVYELVIVTKYQTWNDE